MEFTPEQNKIIKENYLIKTKQELMDLIPGRTWQSIIMRAQKMDCGHRPNNSSNFNLKRLLSEELESYFWIGFIYADGYFEKQKRFHIKVSSKDTNHLQKLADYLSYGTKLRISENNTMVSFSIRDQEIIKKLYEKFDFKDRKTYNPPNTSIFDKMTDNQFLSFLAGYIDGDGCIKDGMTSIVLACHANWFNVYSYWEQKLYKILNYEKIRDGWSAKVFEKSTNFGTGSMCQITWTDRTLLKLFKNKLKTFNLPLMERKWDRIDENYISRLTIAENETDEVEKLSNKNLSFKELQKETRFI